MLQPGRYFLSLSFTGSEKIAPAEPITITLEQSSGSGEAALASRASAIGRAMPSPTIEIVSTFSAASSFTISPPSKRFW